MEGEASIVAITGVGVLTPAGVGPAALRNWLRDPGEVGRPVPDFDAAAYIHNPKVLRSMQRLFQLASAAAVLAMRQAGMGSTAELTSHADVTRAGTALATTDISPITADLVQTLEEAGGGELQLSRFGEVALHKLHPFRRLTLLANMAAAHVSLLFGLQGPSFTMTSGVEAAQQAVAESYWTIVEGRADLMVCEAGDSPAYGVETETSREAAGALVLERWSSAKARGAAVVGLLRATAASGGVVAARIDEEPLRRCPASGGLLSMIEAVDRLSGADPQRSEGVAAGAGLQILPASYAEVAAR